MKSFEKLKFALLVFSLTANWIGVNIHAAEPTKRLLAYYYPEASHSTPRFTAAKIPYHQLTHIAHVAVQPAKVADGSLHIGRDVLSENIVVAAHQAGVRVLICVQGSAETFSKVAANAVTRAAFVKNLRQFVMDHDYDGVDMDWEVPVGKADVANCTALMQGLREALPAPRYELSMATTSNPGGWGEYDFAALTPLLDFYNVMTYDYHGPWAKDVGHNSPLFTNAADPDHQGSLDDSLNLYLNKFQVPPAKINLGTAFYGYEFDSATIGSPVKNEKNVRSRDYGSYIKPLINQHDWARHFDPIAMAPYLVHERGVSGVITYDDAESTARKAIYALQVRDLGGVFMWELSADYDGKNQDLMDALYEATKAANKKKN